MSESKRDEASVRRMVFNLANRFKRAHTSRPVEPLYHQQAVLELVQSVRAEVLNLDAALNASEVPPDGDDYNQLYVVVNCGLINILKAMSDPTDFGE